ALAVEERFWRCSPQRGCEDRERYANVYNSVEILDMGSFQRPRLHRVASAGLIASAFKAQPVVAGSQVCRHSILPCVRCNRRIRDSAGAQNESLSHGRIRRRSMALLSEFNERVVGDTRVA